MKLQPVRVLVVQLWTVDIDPVHRALADAGIAASIVRVDFEAALHAALAHERFDLAIFDAETTTISRDDVLEAFATSGRKIPLVVVTSGHDLAADVLRAISPHRN